MKVSLAIINKNDIRGAQHVIPQIDRNLFCEIFAVDGGSTDGSVEYFESQNIQTHVVTAGGRGGAMRYAADICQGDYIVYFSTDGEENPHDLKHFISAFEKGSDMVTASRIAKGAFHKAQAHIFYYHRLLFLKFITFMVNLLFSSRITDCWNGYRGFNVQKLRSANINASDFMIEAQQTIRFLKRNFKIQEFPTREGKRIAGSSSVPIFKTGFLLLWMLYDEKFGTNKES